MSTKLHIDIVNVINLGPLETFCGFNLSNGREILKDSEYFYLDDEKRDYVAKQKQPNENLYYTTNIDKFSNYLKSLDKNE